MSKGSDKQVFDPSARRVRVSARYIQAIAAYIAQSDVRYYLNGFLVEPHPEEGVLLVATNGHVLGVVHDREGTTNGTWICSLPNSIKKACAAQKKRDPLDTAKWLHFSGEVAHVTNEMVEASEAAEEIGPNHLETAHAPPIDGTYPNWRRVIPEETKPGPRLSANIKYLTMAQQAAKAADVRTECVILYPQDEHGVCLMRVEHFPEFFAMVMPMRAGELDPVPEWLGIGEARKKARSKGAAA